MSALEKRFYRRGNKVIDRLPEDSEDSVLCTARSGHAAENITQAMNARVVYLPRLRAQKRREAKRA